MRTFRRRWTGRTSDSRVLVVLMLGTALAACSPSAPPELLDVRIVLDNQCEFSEGAFMVVSEPSGQRAYFRDGRARMRVYSNEKLRLAANAEFPRVTFDSPSVKVKPELVMVADCGGSSERLKRTFEELQNKFTR